MGKLHKLLHPYTFRSRAMGFMLISAIIASFFSLASSFLYSVISVREELALNQHAVALYMIELDQITDLTPEEIVSIADNDILSVHVSIASRDSLSYETQKQIDAAVVAYVYTGPFAQPNTYLRLGDALILIEPSRRLNVITVSFLRVVGSVGMCLMMFVILSWLAARNLSRPITLLTEATQLIGEGDFTVKLPEKSRGEVGELMRSFNAMTDALGRNSYLQKDFISSISHEFRTPIASIRGFARLLQMDGLDEATRREYVDMIAQESDRLSRLSETLLRLSALEQQAAPACLNEFRLDEQLRQVILRLEPTWSPKNIDWQLELQPVTLRSDSELLIQVWINLIQNAVKFSEEDSIIEISVTSDDCGAQVSIRDHGAGMSEETMTRIFDRFYQADHSRSKQGVGLGLCLVKRILDILQGSVKVASVLGEGSTFTVTLPLAPNHYRPTEETHA